MPGAIGTKTDLKLILPRTEYHCARCGGHQGHVFDDGPPPTGKRYCNNGVALQLRRGALHEHARRMASAVFVAALLFAGGPLSPADRRAPVPGAGAPAGTAKAVFAGGCFWCVESDFDKVAGVISTTSGYTGGNVRTRATSRSRAGRTGHAEAVQIVFDPAEGELREAARALLAQPSIRPTKTASSATPAASTAPAIFVHDAEQLKSRKPRRPRSRKRSRSRSRSSPIVMAGAFYPAEDYHQDYYKKNPVRYHFYR